MAKEYKRVESLRRHNETPQGKRSSTDSRTPFERDRDRIIHSAAFRRLSGKTQVFGMGGSDFFRTRLTHSLETAQIGKGIALFCGHANTELVEAACLAHDIGHPPFGHTGENALKELMRDVGGYEANAQNLRILDKLEVRSNLQKSPGLNLTRATLDSLLKYKTPYSEIEKTIIPIEEWKFYYDDDAELVRWASDDDSKTTKGKSLECEMMNWADDIAYSTHDLEDGIKVGMISAAKISPVIENGVRKRIERKGLPFDNQIWDEVVGIIDKMSGRHKTERERKGQRRDIISQLIHSFITSTKVKKRSKKNDESLASRYEYSLDYDPKERLRCNLLKALVWELIINDERLATLRRKAMTIVQTLFKEFTKFEDRDLTNEIYPSDFREKLNATTSIMDKKRIACDYISGMTDSYATRMYARLRESEAGSLLDLI